MHRKLKFEALKTFNQITRLLPYDMNIMSACHVFMGGFNCLSSFVIYWWIKLVPLHTIRILEYYVLRFHIHKFSAFSLYVSHDFSTEHHNNVFVVVLIAVREETWSWPMLVYIFYHVCIILCDKSTPGDNVFLSYLAFPSTRVMLSETIYQNSFRWCLKNLSDVSYKKR